MEDDDLQERSCRGPTAPPWSTATTLAALLQPIITSRLINITHQLCRLRFPLAFGLVTPAPSCSSLPSGMRKSPDVSPRRLSDISPQLRQLKYLVVDEAIKEDLKSSRSVEDINSASIEERILRITGYYGYQPWSASYKSESLCMHMELLTSVTP